MLELKYRGLIDLIQGDIIDIGVIFNLDNKYKLFILKVNIFLFKYIVLINNNIKTLYLIENRLLRYGY